MLASIENCGEDDGTEAAGSSSDCDFDHIEDGKNESYFTNLLFIPQMMKSETVVLESIDAVGCINCAVE